VPCGNLAFQKFDLPLCGQEMALESIFCPKKKKNPNKMRGCRRKKGRLRLKQKKEKRREKFKGESQGRKLEDVHSGSEHRNFFRVLISSN